MTDAYAAALAKASKSAQRKEKRRLAAIDIKLSGAAKAGIPICSDLYVCPRNNCFDTVKHSHGKPKKKKSPSMSLLKKKLWEELRFVIYAESPVCRACGLDNEPVACHIVPSSDSAATKFFLPNIYRGCGSCNDAERRRRAQWVKRHEEIFGVDYVNALYDFSKTEFQLKRSWVIEQTERMRNLRGIS